MKPQHQGFTLIELLVFIVVSSLLMGTMFIGITNALRNTPTVHNQWLALRLGRQCLDWFYRRREVQGYSVLACATTIPCGAYPGFTVNATFTCTTWNGDPNYKTMTVNVAGLVNITMTGLIGDF